MAACIPSSSELWLLHDNSLFYMSVVRLLYFASDYFANFLNCQYLSKHAAVAFLTFLTRILTDQDVFDYIFKCASSPFFSLKIKRLP